MKCFLHSDKLIWYHFTPRETIYKPIMKDVRRRLLPYLSQLCRDNYNVGHEREKIVLRKKVGNGVQRLGKLFCEKRGESES